MKTTANSTDRPESIVESGLMTVDESRQFLKVGRSKLYSLMDAGELAFVKLGKARRIPRAALVMLAERCLVGEQ